MKKFFSYFASRKALASLVFAIPPLAGCSSAVDDRPASAEPPAASNQGVHTDNRVFCDSWRRYFAGRQCNDYNSTKGSCDAPCIGVDTSCQFIYDTAPEGNYCAHAGGCQGGLYACHAGACVTAACHFAPGDRMDQCSPEALTTSCVGSAICRTADECPSSTPFTF